MQPNSEKETSQEKHVKIKLFVHESNEPLSRKIPKYLNVTLLLLVAYYYFVNYVKQNALCNDISNVMSMYNDVSGIQFGVVIVN